MITFTLGFVAAIVAGALVWAFVTLYKLKKKFNWMTDTWKDMMADHSEFKQMYWRNREDDQRSLQRNMDDFQRHIETYFVTKEDLKLQEKKTLIKG